MIVPIQPIASIPMPDATAAVGQAGQAGQAADFQKMLESAVHHVEITQAQANESTARMLEGDTRDLHSVMLDVQRSELSFDLFVQVRNKVMQAYQEVMRVQL